MLQKKSVEGVTQKKTPSPFLGGIRPEDEVRRKAPKDKLPEVLQVSNLIAPVETPAEPAKEIAEVEEVAATEVEEVAATDEQAVDAVTSGREDEDNSTEVEKNSSEVEDGKSNFNNKCDVTVTCSEQAPLPHWEWEEKEDPEPATGKASFS